MRQSLVLVRALSLTASSCRTWLWNPLGRCSILLSNHICRRAALVYKLPIYKAFYTLFLQQNLQYPVTETDHALRYWSFYDNLVDRHLFHVHLPVQACDRLDCCARLQVLSAVAVLLRADDT